MCLRKGRNYTYRSLPHQYQMILMLEKPLPEIIKRMELMDAVEASVEQKQAQKKAPFHPWQTQCPLPTGNIKPGQGKRFTAPQKCSEFQKPGHLASFCPWWQTEGLGRSQEGGYPSKGHVPQISRKHEAMPDPIPPRTPQRETNWRMMIISL